VESFHSEVKRQRRVKKRSKPGPRPSSLPPDEHAYIEAGRAALALPHKTFEAWVVMGKAIQLLRAKADRIGTREAFARLLGRIIYRVNELRRAAEGGPQTLARKKFGSAEGGSRLHSAGLAAAGGAGSALTSRFGISPTIVAAALAGAGALADASPPEARACDASGGKAPISDHDAGGTKPPAFTPDVIEQLRAILKPVRERLFEFTMEKWADLARGDRQEFSALTQNMKRGRKRPKDEVGRFAALLLAMTFEEFTGRLPGRSSRGRETTDTKLRDKNSPFYGFSRAACDAAGVDVSDAALKAAIAKLKGRGKLEANLLELRRLLWRGLPMAAADYEQVRVHFSMALDAVARGKLLSDVLSPGPPVEMTVGGALIDAAVHLQEPLEDMQKDRLAEIVLRALR